MTAIPLLDVRDLTVEFMTRRGIVTAVQHVDLTIASVSPLATSMLMLCTALTMPRRVENSTVRSLMSSSGGGGGALLRSGSLRSMKASRAPLRIDDVA